MDADLIKWIADFEVGVNRLNLDVRSRNCLLRLVHSFRHWSEGEANGWPYGGRDWFARCTAEANDLFADANGRLLSFDEWVLVVGLRRNRLRSCVNIGKGISRKILDAVSIYLGNAEFAYLPGEYGYA